MIEYTIAAIPTMYRGRQYRSRLEAKWAAFFDLLGWKHEYEPFDLGRWSPDFRIHGPEVSALVEIKPIDDIDSETADRMVAAVEETRTGEFLLLLGNAPAFEQSASFIGWQGIRCNPTTWVPAPLVWIAETYKPEFTADIMVLYGEDQELYRGGKLAFWSGSFTAHQGEIVNADDYRPYGSYLDYTRDLWAKACNAVQWRPPA